MWTVQFFFFISTGTLSLCVFFLSSSYIVILRQIELPRCRINAGEEFPAHEDQKRTTSGRSLASQKRNT